ncbi:DUF2147 domain-containing protein [Sphingorhabdus arenilitoris]|uniref:DUF2147 domain-containing protein n=1 Tax=Sphingorhabdus arenilitoris TaxID=1490041 RepID=A0ABV8RG62_9SPHN
MQQSFLRNATLGAIALTTASAAYAAPASVNGQWVTQDKDAVVSIGPCGATICGKLSQYLVTPPNGVGQKDVNNPNKSLRSRKLLGTAFLTGFKADGTQWRGTIYDPKTGKTYRSVMYKGKSGNLIVKGCIGPFCQSQTWTPR